MPTMALTEGWGLGRVAHGEGGCEMSFMTIGGVAFHLVGKRKSKEYCKSQHDIIRFGFLQNALTLVAGDQLRLKTTRGQSCV